MGTAFGIHWLLFFLSVKTGGAAVATIGMSTYGLHLIVLGWLLGRGRVTVVDGFNLPADVAGGGSPYKKE